MTPTTLSLALTFELMDDNNFGLTEDVKNICCVIDEYKMELDLEMALLFEKAEDHIRALPLDGENPEEILAQLLRVAKLAQEAKAILPEGEWSFNLLIYNLQSKPSIRYCAPSLSPFRLIITFSPPQYYSYTLQDQIYNYFKEDVHIEQAYNPFSKHRSICYTSVSIKNLGMVLVGVGIPIKVS